MNHPQQPREYDAVLGGNSPSLEGAAVLGGIEGVKLRLQNPDTKVRIAALEQALNYGEQGLDLVIAGLKDKSWDIQNAAYLLLKSRTEEKISQVLIESDAHLRKGGSIDYSQLRDFLASEKWEEADTETWRLMVRVVEKYKSGYKRSWLNDKAFESDSWKGFIGELFPDLKYISCEDFSIIDHLWVKYSSGKFGFSVQKRIAESSNLSWWSWEEFGDRVGWRREGCWLSKKNFDKTAPEGHLPALRGCSLEYAGGRSNMSELFMRIRDCGL